MKRDKQIIEKLKEVVEHIGGTDLEGCPICEKLMKEIEVLEEQPEEESYPSMIEQLETMSNNYQVLNGQYVISKNVLDVFIDYWKSNIK